MDILTNSGVLTDAIGFIERSKEKLRRTPSSNEGEKKSSAEQEEEHESKILKAMKLINQPG